MSKNDIILIIVILFSVGVFITRKYLTKNRGDFKPGQSGKKDSLLSSRTKDDDYEPYSKK